MEAEPLLNDIGSLAMVLHKKLLRKITVRCPVPAAGDFPEAARVPGNSVQDVRNSAFSFIYEARIPEADWPRVLSRTQSIAADYTGLQQERVASCRKTLYWRARLKAIRDCICARMEKISLEWLMLPSLSDQPARKALGEALCQLKIQQILCEDLGQILYGNPASSPSAEAAGGDVLPG